MSGGVKSVLDRREGSLEPATGGLELYCRMKEGSDVSWNRLSGDRQRDWHLLAYLQNVSQLPVEASCPDCGKHGSLGSMAELVDKMLAKESSKETTEDD